MSKESRVRYGRVSTTRAPKNTLVTVRQGDTVYFGIARCNMTAGDEFRRQLGTTIATNRARLATEGLTDSRYTCNEGTVNLHYSGLRGSVPVSQIRALLVYFDSIDALRYDLATYPELQVG